MRCHEQVLINLLNGNLEVKNDITLLKWQRNMKSNQDQTNTKSLMIGKTKYLESLKALDREIHLLSRSLKRRVTKCLQMHIQLLKKLKINESF